MIGAVDIGGTKIAVAVVEPEGRIVERMEWPTSDLPPGLAVRRMAQELSTFGHPLQGIGVGCTGPVDAFSGTFGRVDLLPGWTGFELAKRLAEESSLRVAVENDADAAALAETWWGAGKAARRFIYVTVSTGIGTGMVFDGVLYRGVGGAHPEAGHQLVDPAGPLCYCGASGCWESLASGLSMSQWMKANDGRDLTARDICTLARSGDEMAQRAVVRLGDYLGLGLANLVNLFCPDVIAMGGGVMESGDLFLDRARQLVLRLCSLVPAEKTAIVPAAFGRDAVLLGAAAVWLSRVSESKSKLAQV